MSPRISIRLLAGQPDQRLAVLAGEGHERAFEALVHRYRRPLLRYCRRMQLPDTRAEDVLQQAFLQAWTALGRGTEVREVRPWLYRIVHNTALNAMRGNAEEHRELTETVQIEAALADESNLQRRIAVRDALAEVAALPRMQQRAIFLTAIDGQSHDEVARVLGISEGSLRGLLYRARATLRAAAAALTPPSLIGWAAGGVNGTGSSTEWLATLTSNGAAVGTAGALAKGVVAAITVGAVASGAAVVHLRAPSPGRADRAPRAGSAELTAAIRPTALAMLPSRHARSRPHTDESRRKGSPRARHGRAPARARREGRDRRRSSGRKQGTGPDADGRPSQGEVADETEVADRGELDDEHAATTGVGKGSGSPGRTRPSSAGTDGGSGSDQVVTRDLDESSGKHEEADGATDSAAVSSDTTNGSDAAKSGGSDDR
jgi:RNA polymerase sigma factor (sigma-70 family)